jgi:hypothetical protein
MAVACQERVGGGGMCTGDASGQISDPLYSHVASFQRLLGIGSCHARDTIASIGCSRNETRMG